jgi:hypothetical protein
MDLRDAVSSYSWLVSHGILPNKKRNGFLKAGSRRKQKKGNNNVLTILKVGNQ